MRWAALLVLCWVGGCHFASIDPEAMLAEHAGPGATACGALEWSGFYEARDCVLAARADHRAWWVSLDQGVSDGRELAGFADDGAHVIEIDYEAVYSMGIGGDDESVSTIACNAFGDRGPRCDQMAVTLCFVCLP